jgi:ribosome-associated translation inhibitor RaiA
MRLLHSIQSATAEEYFLFVAFIDSVIMVNKESSKVFSIPTALIPRFATNIAINANNSILIATFDDKTMYTWNIETQEVLSMVSLKKKANGITVGSYLKPLDATTTTAPVRKEIVLMIDKVGDIWAFDIYNLQHHVYVTGHPVSITTDITINPSQTLIATSDRDEKIKLSYFPVMENIYGYLFGHKNVISSIDFVFENDQTNHNNNHQFQNYLISTGWDHRLLLWNITTLSIEHEYLLNNQSTTTVDTTTLTAIVAEPSTTTIAATTTEETEEDGEVEKDYNEAQAGNYPFKLVSNKQSISRLWIAMIYKGEKRVSLFTIITATVREGTEAVEVESKQLIHIQDIPLVEQPLDIVYLNPTTLAILLPYPHYLQIFSLPSTSVVDSTSSPREVTDITDQLLSSSIRDSFQNILGKVILCCT